MAEWILEQSERVSWEGGCCACSKRCREVCQAMKRQSDDDDTSMLGQECPCVPHGVGPELCAVELWKLFQQFGDKMPSWPIRGQEERPHFSEKPATCPQAVSPENPLSSGSNGDSRWLITSGHSRGWRPQCFCVRPLAAGAQVPELRLCFRGTQAGPWPVRRMVWLTSMASSAGVTAVDGPTSQESTPVCPIMWTGSVTA